MGWSEVLVRSPGVILLFPIPVIFWIHETIFNAVPIFPMGLEGVLPLDPFIRLFVFGMMSEQLVAKSIFVMTRLSAHTLAAKHIYFQTLASRPTISTIQSEMQSSKPVYVYSTYSPGNSCVPTRCLS